MVVVRGTRVTLTLTLLLLIAMLKDILEEPEQA